LIYINDLPCSISNNCLLYADDLKIWSTEPNTLQIDIDAVFRWSEDWGLPINLNKCSHISFGGDSCNTFGFNLADGFSELPKKTDQKDLGVKFSSTLTFTKHHQATAAKAFSVLRMLKRAFPRIDKQAFIILYGVYIRPILEYANAITYSSLKKDQNTLERVQRAATKAVHGLSNTSYTIRMRILDLYSLDVRRLRGDLMFTYSLFQSGLAEVVFDMAETRHLRGHERKIFLPRSNTLIRHSFFTCRIVNAWNLLPPDVVMAVSKASFKTRLDSYLSTHSSFLLPSDINAQNV
jgi:hypothetical protein